MKISRVLLVGATFVIVGACGSDSGSSGCGNFAGVWSVNGDCPNLSNCTVSQTGCAVTITCDGGSALTGTASNSSLSFSDSTNHCSATIDRTTGEIPTAKGSCTSSAGTCSYTGTCTSGVCTSANEPKSSGSGTGGSAGGGPAADSGGLDPTCSNGVDAVCTCEDAAGATCDAQTLYDACVAKDPNAAPVACFAGFVMDGQIDCAQATTTCIQNVDAGPQQCVPADAPNDCTACIETNCCSQWLACTDVACAGSANPGEFACMQTCFVAGGTSIAACTAQCATTGTTLAPTTQALLDCAVKADSTGAQACSTQCFAEMVQP
jgi:hypothetical protein